jgi:hypothetical protein
MFMWSEKPREATVDLKVLVESIISELGMPITDDERKQGWNAALKIRWRDWFVCLDHLIVAGSDIPAGWGIARAMDFDGVGRTPITTRASKIGRLLDQGIRY